MTHRTSLGWRSLSNMSKLKFISPAKVFKKLKDKYQPVDVPNLVNKLQSSHRNTKTDREYFYGAIFCGALNRRVRDDRYFLRTSDAEPGDFEIVDRTRYYENQRLGKNKRVPDHFRFQNVMITQYDIEKYIQKGTVDFYEIVADHLYQKKLDRKAGDYRDFILLLHFRANIRGMDIEMLRRKIRAIEQENFDQIWISSFSSDRYDKLVIAELLNDDEQLVECSINIL